MSIDRLPDELLSRIFTVGADDETAASDVAGKQGKLKHGRQFPKAFTQTVAPVCHRWHGLTKDRANAHLWMVVASVRIGNKAPDATESCMALAKFKHIIENTENGRCDIYADLSTRRGSPFAYLDEVRLLMLAVSILVPHQRRLAGLKITFPAGDCLDFLMETIIHRFSYCPRLHVIKLRATAGSLWSGYGYLDFKLLHSSSTNVTSTPFSLNTFQCHAFNASQAFQRFEGLIISPFLRSIQISPGMAGMKWAELLDIFARYPNLEVFVGELLSPSGPPMLLNTELPKLSKLKRLGLTSNDVAAFAFVRKMPMAILEQLSIRVINQSSIAPQFDTIGSPPFLPSLKTLKYVNEIGGGKVASIAHLALFPRLKSVELDSPLATLPRMDLIAPDPIPAVSTESLFISAYFLRIYSLPDQFKQIDLQNVVNLYFIISNNDPDFDQRKEESTPPLQLHKLRTLKIRVVHVEMMLPRFLWTVAQFRSPYLETAICCYASEVDSPEFVRLSFASSSTGDDQKSGRPCITSMTVRAESQRDTKFLKNSRGGPLYLELLSDLKNLTIKLGSGARSAAEIQATFKFLGSFLAIGLLPIPSIIPLPALDEFRVVVTGDQLVSLRFFPVARQILDDLEIMRSRTTSKATRFNLEMEVGLGKTFHETNL